jgi:aldose 1-epimerase
MDARTHTMAAGDLVAIFLPERGMLGISLTHRGEEILRLVDDLDDAAAQGRSVGIPINHPWANRLRGAHYRAAGRDVELAPQSPWLLRDWNDVIIHGVPWSKLGWHEVDRDQTSLVARLRWNRPELLEVFPFDHELEMRATLDAVGLTVETTVIANGRDAIPVSFGFHPYIAIPGLPRAQWQLSLPAMQSIVLDELLLPTGRREPFPAMDEKLAAMDFDHGFALETDSTTMSIAGNGRRVSVDFLEGFPYAQIYAPPDHDHISLEPMTAPANALVSGEGLRLVEPGERFTAVFRIRVESLE